MKHSRNRRLSTIYLAIFFWVIPMVAVAQGPTSPQVPFGLRAAPNAKGPGGVDAAQGIKMALQMMQEAATPLTEKDIQRFFKLAEEVLTWLDKNKKPLKAIDALPPEQRWARIQALGLPNAIRETSDFFPLAMKIHMARATSDQAAVTQAKQKRAEFEQRQAMIQAKLAQLPEAQRGLVLEMMTSTRKSLDLFINYPAESRALYAKHRKKIDKIFEQMETLGQTSGGGMPSLSTGRPGGAKPPGLRPRPRGKKP